MIGYATIGTNDLERAKTFYDAVLEPLGGRRTFANGERMQFYGSKETPGMIAISKPYDDQPATVGNGSMFGLRPSRRSTPPMPPRWRPAGPAMARPASACRPSTAPISAIRTATRSASSTWVEPMIGYTTLGVNDLERARAFYDAALAPLGGRRTLTYERSQYYGSPERGAMLGITLPFDGSSASVGNGVMVALKAGSAAAVEQVHAAAMSAGAVCEAYFRDLDGNKLCAFFMG
jgi:catechol 2,3-dioxygenase-like lactoylglutathione lyase family enzyme